MHLRVALRCFFTAGLVAIGLGCGDPAGEGLLDNLPYGVEAGLLSAHPDRPDDPGGK